MGKPSGNNSIYRIYDLLYSHFGPQHWWPGDTPFEVAVGAILTQNTNWGNVEKAIKNLREGKLLNASALYAAGQEKLASLIRPAGYFNVKSRRLRNFLELLHTDYKGSMKKMGREDLSALRGKLLSVNGIGPETADSILLYACEKPVFVVDAYTKRVFSRHNILGHDEPYDTYQDHFHEMLERDVQVFNEYHALLVRLAKEHCRPRPLCSGCPLEGV